MPSVDESERSGRLRILEADGRERAVFDLAVHDPEELRAAIVGRLLCDTRDELFVGGETGVAAIVLKNERQLPGREVEAVDIVPAGIAVVQADEDAVLDHPADADNQRPRFFERRERLLGAGGDIDAVEKEVLVATAVVQEQDLFESGDQKY